MLTHNNTIDRISRDLNVAVWANDLQRVVDTLSLLDIGDILYSERDIDLILNKKHQSVGMGYSETALNYACRSGFEEMVYALLDNPYTDINARDTVSENHDHRLLSISFVSAEL